jgi:hypothetical protein
MDTRALIDAIASVSPWLTEEDRINVRTYHAPSMLSRVDSLERTVAELLGGEPFTLTAGCSAAEFSRRAATMRALAVPCDGLPLRSVMAP